MKKVMEFEELQRIQTLQGFPPPPSPPGYALTLNVLSHSDGKMEVFFILELTDVEETKCTP